MLSRHSIRDIAFIAFLISATIRWGSVPVRATSVFNENTTAPSSVPNTASSPTGTTEVKEIFQLNTEIKEKQKRLQELRDRIAHYQQSITSAQTKSKTLRNQVAILEDRIERKKLSIEATVTEREQVELEIAANQLELNTIQQHYTTQRRLLAGLLIELDAAERQAPLTAFLTNASFGSYFAHRNQLALLEEDVRRTLAGVRLNRDNLQSTEAALATRQNLLQALADQLNEERGGLEEEQGAKQRLLFSTRQNEANYQKLLQNLRAEQEQIDQDIVSLDAKVRERLIAIDSDFGRIGRVAFSWPVPNRGITAYFHDPEYPYRNVFEHPAIDIRSAQGSPVAAAAPGYVARAKNAGYGYSYIMLIHPGGFATVYGHVSQINVKEDTYVTRGQIIGLSGGRPGTRGAGNLTSGPHLHFEVRLNGIPVNPLNYLL